MGRIRGRRAKAVLLAAWFALSLAGWMGGGARAVGEERGGMNPDVETGDAAPLPVTFYNERGQKILIRYGTVYEPEGDLHLSLPQELFEEGKTLILTVFLQDADTGEGRARTLTLR